MVWIYAFEGHPSSGPQARSFTERMRLAHNGFLSSHLVLAEVLVLPKRNNDVFTATRYRRFFQSNAVTIVPMSADAANRFADQSVSARATSDVNFAQQKIATPRNAGTEAPGHPLIHEEGRALFDSLYGSMAGLVPRRRRPIECPPPRT